MLKNSLIFASGMVTGAVALAGGVVLWIKNIERQERKKEAAKWEDHGTHAAYTPSNPS